MMNTQLSAIRVINFWLTVLFLGMSSTACQAFSQNTATLKTASPEPAKFSEYPPPALTEEEQSWAAMNWEERVIYNLKRMIPQRPGLEILLSQTHQFKEMGKACDFSRSIEAQGLFDFWGPYQVTQHDSLVVVKCSFNTTWLTPNTVVFHYNDRDGINPIPLQLDQPEPENLSNSTHYFRNWPQFDPQTRELSFEIPCNYRLFVKARLKPRKYTYSFANGKLILQKALWDQRPKCETPPQWTQIYP
ncbi:hypothetical protein [Alkalinema sp. FACHB-956]|uniref:hypothetical protein n=1 Tax=Alkalinema sp. FACHB-956 TaxID=2692768 RepID=UPI001682DB4E|nr:hypothetical protein [Alkalinema sp. FACHB-956]MBD2325482.1 hypothetical protein [Alkalinema sp. FACHB-956]